MGAEIHSQHFQPADFTQFDAHLQREYQLLHCYFADHHFSRRKAIGGLELEAWIIDTEGLPQPHNESFLTRAANPDIVPELSKFNIELNAPPQPLAANGLALFEQDLTRTWAHCQQTAAQSGESVLSIGILPTLRDADLSLANMSDLNRYRAMNEQMMRLRHGRPIKLEITGIEHLTSFHQDLMLEAGATSFQIHLQVPAALAARYWNAATIASAVTVALGANSPLLFGKFLWEETRIPLFEQSVEEPCPEKRVCFGDAYVQSSLEEIFRHNRAHYPVILPLPLDAPEEKLPHLRLHNGTIWRWNRPLIGFDDDGTPHLRIEHRPIAAGPTIPDMIATMAFYYGLVEWMAMEPHAPELRLPFSTAKNNFYNAARLGLAAHIDWYDGKHYALPKLIHDVLLPQAEKGLRALHVDAALTSRDLAIIEARTASGQTGAAFQRRFIARHGRDLPALVRAYRDLQATAAPVHTWPI